MTLAPASRAGRTAMLTVFATVSIAALAGCSAHHTTAASQPPDPDTADCTAGARVIGNLQDTFRSLSDQLGGIAPASEHGDLAEVRKRVGAGSQSAARIDSDLTSVAAQMTSESSKRAFTGVATAGGRLHTALDQLDQAATGAAPAQGAVQSVQQALNGLNDSVVTMRLSCSTVFAETTVAPSARPSPRQ